MPSSHPGGISSSPCFPSAPWLLLKFALFPSDAHHKYQPNSIKLQQAIRPICWFRSIGLRGEPIQSGSRLAADRVECPSCVTILNGFGITLSSGIRTSGYLWWQGGFRFKRDFLAASLKLHKILLSRIVETTSNESQKTCYRASHFWPLFSSQSWWRDKILTAAKLLADSTRDGKILDRKRPFKRP